MGRSSGKLHKRPRRQDIEPLISRQREDGLWQSIEKDDEELESHFPDHVLGPPNRTSLVGSKDDVSKRDPNIEPRRDVSTATATTNTPAVQSKPDDIPAKAKSTRTSHCLETPTTADLPTGRVPNFPFPNTDLVRAAQLAPGPPRPPPPSPDPPQPVATRRRGRPKKSRNTPNWNRRRTVRFSDPIPTDQEAQPRPEPRDTHVFVRLIKINVMVDGHPLIRREELVWNNRAKGWRLAGERIQRNIDDIGKLFDDLSETGSIVRILLAPTVGRGAREAVEMAWDGASCCFQGMSEDLGTLVVALGEVRDMVKDPWARQFVGYVFD